MLKQTLQRWYYRNKVSGTPLAQLWQAASPSLSADWRNTSFLVCDAEMSSLDANSGELLSMGWVTIENGTINLASSRHYLIRNQQSVGDSATIHHLRDCEFDQALSTKTALTKFITASAGKVLVFHNVILDMAYIDKACRTEFNAPLLMPCIDTLLQEQKLLNRHDIPIKTDDLRLQNCRNRYGLPNYPAHNALTDALATAELLIAHAKKRAGKNKLNLRDLL